MAQKAWQNRWIDYYTLLGLYNDLITGTGKGPDSSLQEIKAACRIQRQIWHPDRFKEGTKEWNKANEMMKLINEACAVLDDPGEKKEYNVEWVQRTKEPREKEEASSQFPPEIAVRWDPPDVQSTVFYYIPQGEKRTAKLVIEPRVGRGFVVEILEPRFGWLRILEPSNRKGVPPFTVVVEVDTTGLRPSDDGYRDELLFIIGNHRESNNVQKEPVRIYVAPPVARKQGTVRPPQPFSVPWRLLLATVLFVLTTFTILTQREQLLPPTQPSAIAVATRSSQPTSTPQPTFTPQRTDPRQPISTLDAPLVSPQTPAPPSPADAVVNISFLNLRSGPGVEYPILGAYPQGTTLRVVGKEATGTWLKVETPEGSTGWMHAVYLQMNVDLSDIPNVPAPPIPTSPTNTPIPPATTPALPPSPPIPLSTATSVAACVIPIDSAFDAVWLPQAGCPTTASFTLSGSVERFEGGLMVWRPDEDQVYVLFAKRSVWVPYDDLWSVGEPEFSCPEAQAVGRPLRGFGKVWCGDEDVRVGLGAALEVERGATLRFQPTATGAVFFLVEGEPRQYLLFPTGAYTAVPPLVVRILPTATSIPATATAAPLPPTEMPTVPTPTIPSASTPLPQEKIVSVYANQGWQDTGVFVEEGQDVIIEYMSGLWFEDPPGVWHDATGAPNYWVCGSPECHEPLYNYPKYALIGKVGEEGALLGIGGYFTLVNGLPGILYLRPNYSDEDIAVHSPQGMVTVRIVVNP